MNSKTMLQVVAMVLFTTTIFAQQVPANARTQRQRIAQGIRTGQLTKAERLKIAQQRKEVKAVVGQAKSDGVITPAERAEIKKEKRQINRSIYRKKHNGVVRK